MTEHTARLYLREITRLQKRARRLVWWAKACAVLAAARTWQVG